MRNKYLPLLLLLLLNSCGGSSEKKAPPLPANYSNEVLYDSSNPGNVTYPASCNGQVRSLPDATGKVSGSVTFPARLTSTDSASFTVIALKADLGDVYLDLSNVCFPGVPSSPLNFTLNYLVNNSPYVGDYYLGLDIYYKQPNGFYAIYSGYYLFTGIPARLDVAF